MALNHLAALRAASPGSISAREMSRRIGCSVQAVSQFETGRYSLGPKLLEKYARELGAKPETVERMFLIEAVNFHKKEAEEAKRRLAALPRGRFREGRVA